MKNWKPAIGDVVKFKDEYRKSRHEFNQEHNLLSAYGNGAWLIRSLRYRYDGELTGEISPLDHLKHRVNFEPANVVYDHFLTCSRRASLGWRKLFRWKRAA